MEVMNNNEDAMTHGVTVMECEEQYREVYFKYLLTQRELDRISQNYFESLVEGFVND